MFIQKDKIMIYLIGLIMSSTLACSSPHPSNPQSEPISHELFDQLLKKHVSDDGWVNYEGFKKDREILNKYLDLIRKNAPNDSWSKNDQLAYWINAYNAFTIDLVLQYYPVKSIRDIGSSIQIPFVNSPWDIKFIEIGDEKLDLNNIEHGIIREKFNEPRIHFAVNCASFSCPVLRKEAYKGHLLDQQLEEQTVLFINDPLRNKITAKKAELSKLFSWYKGDFTNGQRLEDFINQYSKTEITQSTKIVYLPYDWSLNISQ